MIGFAAAPGWGNFEGMLSIALTDVEQLMIKENIVQINQVPHRFCYILYHRQPTINYK